MSITAFILCPAEHARSPVVLWLNFKRKPRPQTNPHYWIIICKQLTQLEIRIILDVIPLSAMTYIVPMDHTTKRSVIFFEYRIYVYYIHHLPLYKSILRIHQLSLYSIALVYLQARFRQGNRSTLKSFAATANPSRVIKGPSYIRDAFEMRLKGLAGRVGETTLVVRGRTTIIVQIRVSLVPSGIAFTLFLASPLPLALSHSPFSKPTFRNRRVENVGEWRLTINIFQREIT